MPTVGGEIVFNDIYALNPLVNVFCLGIARKDGIFWAKAAGSQESRHLFQLKDGAGRDPRRDHGVNSFDEQAAQSARLCGSAIRLRRLLLEASVNGR